MKVLLTQDYIDTAVAAGGADRTIHWDIAQPGFGLMTTAAGAKSFVVQYRANGSSRRATIDGRLSLKAAKKQAKILQGQVATGSDPVVEKRHKAELATGTVRAVAELYLKREGGRLRTANQRKSILERCVYPKIGTRPIGDVRRSEIVKLLDHIADDRGPVIAARTFEIVRKIMNWHAGRSDTFRTPIVRGMWTIDKKTRQRVLNEDELRRLWSTAGSDPFSLLVRFVLLTATRRNEAAHMRWDEIAGDEWTIPSARYKNKPGHHYDHLVPLSYAARALLAKLPRMGAFAFTTDGKRPIAGFSAMKRRFDKQCGVAGWTLHDLRRTARSLMSQAGVPPDHAERAIGHVIGGVRGTYDRHAYKAEKRAAFEALAALVEQITS
jgi:integrase